MDEAGTGTNARPDRLTLPVGPAAGGPHPASPLQDGSDRAARAPAEHFRKTYLFRLISYSLRDKVRQVGTRVAGSRDAGKPGPAPRAQAGVDAGMTQPTDDRRPATHQE